MYRDVFAQVPFQPTKAIFVGVDILLSVRVPILFPSDDTHSRSNQAAAGISASYDSLADLFECVSNFLGRFQIYTEKVSLSPMMSDIMVKIMIDVLSVLALATKQINQGRFSKWRVAIPYSVIECGKEKFTKKLLGESDVEAVLQRLDRLTQEEARLTVAHTLEVVHGLFSNLRVVINGA